MKAVSIAFLSCLLLVSCSQEKKKPETPPAKAMQEESPLEAFLQSHKDALEFKELFPAFSQKNLLAVPYSIDLDAKLDSVRDTSILFYAQLADITPDSTSDSSFVARFISPFPFPQVAFQLDLICNDSQLVYLTKNAPWDSPIESRGFAVVGRDISGTRPALQLHVSSDVADPYASTLSLRTPEMIYLRGQMVDVLYVTNIFDLTEDTTTAKASQK